MNTSKERLSSWLRRSGRSAYPVSKEEMRRMPESTRLQMERIRQTANSGEVKRNEN